jgi:hypothetical protein
MLFDADHRFSFRSVLAPSERHFGSPTWNIHRIDSSPELLREYEDLLEESGGFYDNSEPTRARHRAIQGPL